MRTLSLVLGVLSLLSAPWTISAETVVGTVQYADASPAAGAVVYALNARRPLAVRNNVVMVGEKVPRALTDRDGHFELDVDSAGVTELFAQDMEDRCAVTKIERVDSPVTITIDAPAEGEVRVFRGPHPAPEENVQLTKNDAVPGIRFTYAGKTNDAGVFRLPPLAPGDYTVSTWEEVPQVGCCFRSVVTRAAKVRVAPGEQPAIELGGTDLPAVTGTIASADGDPLHGVWVRLIPKNTAPGDADAVVHSAVTERDGSYSVYDVPPGDYEVRCFRRLAMNDGGRTLESVTDLTVPQGTDRNVPNDVTIDLAPFLPLEPGRPAPSIEGTTLDGQPFRLSDLSGQYVVIHFYAGWCKPCVETIDWFDTIMSKFGDTANVTVLGISLDETETEARNFAQEKDIGHPVIYAGSWSSNPIRKTYRVVNIPTTVIIGPDGAIAHFDLHGQVLLDYLRKQLAS